MSLALMSSGGKDSTLALDRARRDGLDVRYLVNVYDGPSQRVAFHGTRQSLIAAQAAALGLEHLSAPTGPDAPFESVFLDILDHLRTRSVTGMLFGNIHLADVREWYETRVREAGMDHLEPLWEDAPNTILREIVDRQYRGIVVSVDLEQGAGDLLAREIDEAFVTDVSGLSIDTCGERGEYHTFVYDGPTFAHPVPVERGEIRHERNHGLLDLMPLGGSRERV